MIAVLCAVESLELPNATRRAALGAAVTFVAGRHAARAADDAPKFRRPPLTQSMSDGLRYTRRKSRRQSIFVIIFDMVVIYHFHRGQRSWQPRSA